MEDNATVVAVESEDVTAAKMTAAGKMGADVAEAEAMTAMVDATAEAEDMRVSMDATEESM